VCLRLARARDLSRIRALAERQGVDLDQLTLTRLVRADPREQVVICATALIDGLETMLGVGSIDLGQGLEPEPALLIVDIGAAEGLDELLTDALVGRARALDRARAA
jgi:hypothetical protein